MKKKDLSRERTTIYLTPDISEALKKSAMDEDRSFTKQIERILKDWLIEHGHLKKEQ
ncbi:MAG: hypothetical protein JETT_3120 [Candidatus Jettenia ecosi]|uniref:Ribbon-helix-helix protein CopG domain-containing protein n=1 Tax=Candidatus Jettenia ecosi TaxID=2494326 RepID=A0A533Q7L6_9BACT|nr:MAG: hypothetical protein JETT_3120 [Candidatus Jettenia ecosi]